MAKRCVTVFFVLLNVMAGGSICQAQSYPTKPVRFVVPFAPGGGMDLMARIIAQKLTEAWTQPIVVDNRAGASGNIGMGLVARTAPDGYTMLLASSNIVVNPLIYKKTLFDPFADFAPISLTAKTPQLLAAYPSVPASTVNDLVLLSRTRPGALSYATPGVGTVGHMVAELFKIAAKVDMAHIPYKGTGTAITDLLGGRVDLMFSAPAAVLPHLKTGKLKGIAVTSDNRETGLEDIPTFVEAGYREVRAYNWFGVFVPSSTPARIVEKIHREIVRILELPDIKTNLTSKGYSITTTTPSELAHFMKSEREKWRKVVTTSRVHIDN